MKWIVLFLSMVVMSCANIHLEDITLRSTKAEDVSLAVYKKNKVTAFYFLSPECPLCQNYALNINQLQIDFRNDSVQFFGVFPGTYYSQSQIKNYLIKYEIGVESLLDPNYELTHLLDATITPEVVVIGADGNILYQGAIDNWAISLGKKRTVVTEHYLKDALMAILNDQEIRTKKSVPVGCFIE